MGRRGRRGPRPVHGARVDGRPRIGWHAFDRGDGNEAARLWDRVALLGPPGSPVVQQAREGAAEARKMAAERAGPAGGAAAPALGPAQVPATAPATTNATTQGPGAPQKAPVAGPTVRGTVTLSAALKAQAKPEDTVFIFARNAEAGPGAPRMPLAIVRKQVKDLPVDFVLDDSMAMSPGAKLSLFPQVVVSARVSKSGQAVPSAGDLSGQSAPIAPTASGLLIEINEVVKN